MFTGLLLLKYFIKGRNLKGEKVTITVKLKGQQEVKGKMHV